MDPATQQSEQERVQIVEACRVATLVFLTRWQFKRDPPGRNALSQLRETRSVGDKNKGCSGWLGTARMADNFETESMFGWITKEINKTIRGGRPLKDYCQTPYTNTVSQVKVLVNCQWVRTTEVTTTQSSMVFTLLLWVSSCWIHLWFGMKM